MTYENFISLPPVYEFRGLKLVQIAVEQATVEHVLRLALDGKLAGVHRFSDALLKLGTHYAIIEELDGHFVVAENLPFLHFTKLDDAMARVVAKPILDGSCRSHDENEEMTVFGC